MFNWKEVWKLIKNVLSFLGVAFGLILVLSMTKETKEEKKVKAVEKQKGSVEKQKEKVDKQKDKVEEAMKKLDEKIVEVETTTEEIKAEKEQRDEQAKKFFPDN